jgi:hypothetical protein
MVDNRHRNRHQHDMAINKMNQKSYSIAQVHREINTKFNGKKNLLIIPFLLLLNSISHADQGKFVWCPFYANYHAKTAYDFGRMYEIAINASAPGSPERKSLVDIISKKWDEKKDSEYLIAKEVERKELAKGTHHSEIVYHIAMSQMVLTYAGLVAIDDPGRSQVHYQRIIENRCILGK